MSEFRPPVEDMRFVLREIAGIAAIAALPGYQDASADVIDAALEEAAKFAGGVLAPLNATGDKQGVKLENGVVRTPDGFADAYKQLSDAGWTTLPFDPAFGGQGMPWLMATAVQEMWQAANMSFGLVLLLSQGAIDAIHAHGSAEQQATYLPNMIAGKWTGTMNLTEPQAGSDLGVLRSRAVKDGDHYKISGQKIFITYGEHDMVENIVHLVLARTPDAPAGVKGISLFIVPKFLVNPDGSLGERNDLRCVSLEHKLGIHASPTAVMSYGDDGGAIGYLVGQEGRGLEYMFTMMNNARLAVGVQGLAIAERAYQQALEFAKTRVQGRPDVKPQGANGSGPATIIHHPDVRRMLMTMKAHIEAMRAMAYVTAGAIDHTQKNADAATKAEQQALVDLLIPIVKSWCTDLGVELASIGVQIHGGMGFIEETGAAQHYRDARILPIYEGTNGIQARDLVSRKVARNGGETVMALIAQMRTFDQELAATPGDDMAAIRQAVQDGAAALEQATAWVVENYASAPSGGLADVLSGASLYLKLAAYVIGNYLLAKGALAASRQLAAREGDAAFLEAKLVTARFFAETLLPQGTSLLGPIKSAGRTTMALAEGQF
ncbi:MAG: acyl-CoA dehydrogenase, partial [Rhodospirillales bacterium]